MLITKGVPLSLLFGTVCLFGAASLSFAAAQESDERHHERGDRAPERDRERDDDSERARHREPDRARREADRRREGRSAREDRRSGEHRRPAERAPQARERPPESDAARRRHLESAIEHLQAAGLHDLAHGLRRRLQHRSPEGPPRVMRRPELHRPEVRRPGPRGEGDERIRHLINLVEDMHGIVHRSHQQHGNVEAVGRATEEARRGLDELRHHFEQRLHEFEREVQAVSDRGIHDLERSINERFEDMERDIGRQFEEIERFLQHVEERLDDGDHDDDDHEHEEDHDDDGDGDDDDDDDDDDD